MVYDSISYTAETTQLFKEINDLFYVSDRASLFAPILSVKITDIDGDTY
jgi:hypothetical protein